MNPVIQAHKDLLEQILGLDSGLTFKNMFGGAVGYINDKIFVSLSDVGLAIKLPLELQTQLLLVDGTKRLQYSPTDPPSKQYIVIPIENKKLLELWLLQSIQAVQAGIKPTKSRRDSKTYKTKYR